MDRERERVGETIERERKLDEYRVTPTPILTHTKTKPEPVLAERLVWSHSSRLPACARQYSPGPCHTERKRERERKREIERIYNLPGTRLTPQDSELRT